MRLVGLTGHAGSGKDSAAIGLTTLGFVGRSFADPLRKGALGCDPIIEFVGFFGRISRRIRGAFGSHLPVARVVRLSTVVRSLGWDEAKRTYPEVRRFLQAYGTEGGREIHGEDCWTKLAFIDLPEKAVIRDVRFPNEADAIRERGGVVVEIKRPGCGPVNGHVSDQRLPDEKIDGHVWNDTSLQTLGKQIRRTVELLEAQRDTKKGS